MIKNPKPNLKPPLNRTHKFEFLLPLDFSFFLFRDNRFEGETSQVEPGPNPQDKLQFLHHEWVKSTEWIKNKQQKVLLFSPNCYLPSVQNMNCYAACMIVCI